MECCEGGNNVPTVQHDSVVYDVKIININGVQLQKWNGNDQYSNLAKLKLQSKEDLTDNIGRDEFVLGYIEPGHGTKGHKIALKDAEDLSVMYQTHKGRNFCTKHQIPAAKCY